MAKVPYSPEDFGERPEGGIGVAQSIRANPDSFGGQIARATEKIGGQLAQSGQQIAHVGDVFEQVQTDDAFNQAQGRIQKLAHGDPDTPNEDGSPNFGYFGTKGRAALDGRKGFEDQVDEILKEARDGLSGQMAQANFDKMASHYRLSLSERAAGHADRESLSYSADVNKSTADLSLATIANNPDDLQQVAHGTSDLTAAYVKQAQLQGGGEEAVKDAMFRARRDSLKAWTQAIAVKDPSRALEILDKHRDSAGTYYEELAQSFRSRVGSQVGLTVSAGSLAKAQSANGWANPRTPVFSQATQSVQGGYSSPQGLARVIQIESGGNPTAGAGRSHVGLGQFSDETARLVGITDRHDPAQSIFGVQRYAALNRPVLVKALNREPTDGELYLAHQQGPAGASALLTHPNLPASVALTPVYRGNEAAARAAIKGNGGDPDAPASAFTSLWLRKFGQNVTPTAVPAPDAGSVKLPEAYQGRGELAAQPEPSHPDAIPTHQESVFADAYRNAMDPANYPESVRNDPMLFAQAQQHAFQAIHQMYTAQEVAERIQEKQKKDLSNDVAHQIMKEIYNGAKDPNIIHRIAGDDRIDVPMQNTLITIANKEIGNGDEAEKKAYGKGYWKAYDRIFNKDTEEQRRISGFDQLAQLALESAPEDERLTTAGALKLNELLGIKSPDTRNAQQALHHRLAGIGLEMSQDVNAPPGMEQFARDKAGEAIFQNQFSIQYSQMFDKWVAEKKDPYEFLNNQKIVDELKNRLYPRSQMLKNRMTMAIAAGTQAKDSAVINAALAPPENVDETKWTPLIDAPPGKLSKPAWAIGIKGLLNTPTPQMADYFDAEPRFSASGRSARDIIKSLTGKEIPASNAAEPAAVPAGAPGWAPPKELQDKAAREAAAKAEHDRLPPWQTSGLAPWEQR